MVLKGFEFHCIELISVDLLKFVVGGRSVGEIVGCVVIRGRMRM